MDKHSVPNVAHDINLTLQKSLVSLPGEDRIIDNFFLPIKFIIVIGKTLNGLNCSG